MSKTQKTTNKCKWCGKSIKKDTALNKWYAIVKGSTNYYCPQDTNENRCEHKPVKP